MTPHSSTARTRWRAALGLAAVWACAVHAHAYHLISPLSFWPASSAAGPVVFEVNLVAAPPNIPNPPLQDGSTSWNAAFVAQLDSWNAVLPDGVLLLQANTGSGLAPGEGNGRNDVFFSDTIYGDTWGSSTLGICLSSWSGNERVEADILFNATKTWNAYTGNLQGGTSEFRRVALHELGHALLLDHPDDVGQVVPAVMNSQSSNTGALTADDRAGVLAVFGGLLPPTITEQPRPMVTTAGGSFLLNVTVVGSEPLTYQWQRSTNGGSSWSDLPGFTFPNGSGSGLASGTLLRVVATNPGGSVTSRAVLLTASGSATAPQFLIDPVSVSISAGEDVILAAHASGSRMPEYHWEYSSNGGAAWQPVFSSFGAADVSGAQGPTLKIANAIAQMDGFHFRCVATNPAGSATSAAATLAVATAGPAPYFRWQPVDIYTTTGTSTLVPAGVAGTPAPAPQWQTSVNGGLSWSDLTNGATFTGVSSATLTIVSPSLAENGTLLRLRATNSSGTATSRSVMVSVRSAPAAPDILEPPGDVTAPPGQSATFSARLDASPTPVFQWEYSTDGVTYAALADGLFEIGALPLETIISGANTRTLRLQDVDPLLNQARFRLIARNQEGSDTSAAAVLTVGAGGTAPTITAHPIDAVVTYRDDPTFTVSADGTPAPAVQWEVSTNNGASWTAISDNFTYEGAGTPSLMLTDPTVAMSGYRYRAVATNTAGSAASNAAVLTVSPAPVSLTFSNLVRAYTGAPLAPTLTVSPPVLAVEITYDGAVLSPSQVGSYAAVATVTDPNYVGSASATFSIEPGITLNQAGSVTVTAGSATVLGVTASTPAGTTYRWQIQDPGTSAWADIFGATQATYTLASTQHFSAGAYRAIVTYAGVSATSAVTTVSVQPPPASNARVMNLSTRGYGLQGNNVLIPGFVITGTGTKRMLIRGVGPGMWDTFELAGFLPDPRLWLRRQRDGSEVSSNDDWGSNANAAEIATVTDLVGAFPLLPGSKDAALLLDLPPGDYTVPTVGNADGTGIAMVELYDADPDNTGGARLINISTRGFIDVGARIMIPGFVVSSEGSRTFLIRAVGPGMWDTFELAGFLADPVLTVFNSDGQPILDNDDWDGIPGAATTAAVSDQVGAFPLLPGSKDAAFVVTLPPGAYTIQASGKSATTGIAMVEVYLVP